MTLDEEITQTLQEGDRQVVEDGMLSEDDGALADALKVNPSFQHLIGIQIQLILGGVYPTLNEAFLCAMVASFLNGRDFEKRRKEIQALKEMGLE